eukprot:scaffold803_cov310-Pinguiococcus_pyrenoidosus.AAC.198
METSPLSRCALRELIVVIYVAQDLLLGCSINYASGLIGDHCLKTAGHGATHLCRLAPLLHLLVGLRRRPRELCHVWLRLPLALA